MKWAESKLKEEEQRALKYLETSITTIAPPSNYECTVWKNEKFTLTKKIFCEINSFVTSLVLALLSRNFCRKSGIGNFRNFHTVSLAYLYVL